MDRLINQTESICPECLKPIPAQITTDGVRVLLRKVCPDHGESQGLVWSDLRLYERACEQKSPNAQVEPVSKTSAFYYGLLNQVAKRTCLAILDITQQCNTNCPICIADSHIQKKSVPLSVKQIERVIEILRDEAGTKVPIQLSGGEPTVHEDLCSIVEMIREKEFDSVEMNSNGLLLSERPEMAKQLQEVGLKGVFLQFDGLTPSVYEKIRGRNLLDKKLKVIEFCQQADLPVILQPTIVNGVNDEELWNIVQFAISAGVAGIDFLPFTPTGRYGRWGGTPQNRITISDIMKGIEEQSGGRVLADDLYSVPCPDSRCAIISYLLIRKDKLLPITRIVDYSEVKDHYGNLSDWKTVLDSLKKSSGIKPCCSSGCGCSQFDLSADGYFIIGCHGFQDKWNFDFERAKFCCFHELTAEGKLVPFCYYSITRNQWLSSLEKI